ncbi:sulfate permease 2 [Macrophomina phaseolina MS6]|uniref:Sulfate permease 2 n=1 Tax=Macrophomina phaseolina (strain MS6) TaxID=1126212 RepID=K2SEK2_MACPH|nr:sulfate permease 2 [Macrophomina phaseolina MS6]
MKASQVLALTAACCSVASAAAVPDSNAEVKPIVREEHLLEARASVPEEVIGQILDFEIEATIKAITSIVKAPERESAFTHRTPSNIVTNFWNRGYIVAAFCTKFLANCQNCHWKEYSVGGSGGDQ